jgi:hypothetical protein
VFWDIKLISGNRICSADRYNTHSSHNGHIGHIRHIEHIRHIGHIEHIPGGAKVLRHSLFCLHLDLGK